jgi:pimeloyl-ACP methyl ester carboxylesterase
MAGKPARFWPKTQPVYPQEKYSAFRFARILIARPVSIPAKPRQPSAVSSPVAKLFRTCRMLLVIVVAALAILALVTQAGVFALQRAHPARGKMIEVAGATLNVVDIGPRDAPGPPVVMIHGASSNLEVMRQPLGEMLAGNHRVILIDRPGHGWSTRTRLEDSTPAIQGRMIEEALEKLGVGPVVLVVHSWSGALGARMALDYPERVAGLVMLAPVAYPWRGGVGWYTKLVAVPLIGPLLAYTITLPLGYFLAEPGAGGVFLPQVMPDGFVGKTATALLLRPREFLANARDIVTLRAAVEQQAPRYGDIRVPTLVISGELDKTITTNIHSRPFAKAVPNAKLVVLPDVGHMVQNAVPELVISEIEAMIGKTMRGTAAGAAGPSH